MPRSRPPSSPRSCSLTPGGRQTVLGKHSEHQHIRLRDRPTDRPRPTGRVLALTQMASAMLSLSARWTSQLRTCCSPSSFTLHLLRLELVSVYRLQASAAHSTLWSCSGGGENPNFICPSFEMNLRQRTWFISVLFKGSPAAPNSPCRWPALRACQTGWRRGVRFRRASPGRASRLDTAASQRSRRSPSTVGCSPRI